MPSGDDDFKELLTRAIDKQDLLALEQVMIDFPDENYNTVTDSGMSALWLALSPPLDTRVNLEVVNYLLGYVGNDGGHLVNPTQSYRGKTPRHFLQDIQQGQISAEVINLSDSDDLDLLLRAITQAENVYEDRRFHRHFRADVGAIANDSQSSHNHKVVRLARDNIQSLYQHYVLDKQYQLKRASLKFIEETIAKIDDKEKAQQINEGLAYCCQSEFSFVVWLDKDELKINLGELIQLLAYAIDDSGQDVRVEDQREGESHFARCDALMETLYDIATAYGPNAPSCLGGAYNRLGMALAGTHKLVKTHSTTPISGAVAHMMIRHYLGKQLRILSQQSLQTYWRVLRYQLFEDPDESLNKKMYRQYIAKHVSIWRSDLVNNKNINEEEVDHFLPALNDSFPLEAHYQSWQLLILLNAIMHHDVSIISKLKLHEALAVNEGLCRVIHSAASLMVDYPLWQQFCSQVGAKLTHDIAEAFVTSLLARARQNEACFDALVSLWHEHATLTEGQSLLLEQTCLLALFDMQKKAMQKQYPQHAAWLNYLSREQVVRLLMPQLKTLGASFPWQQLATLVPKMVENAFDVGCVRHLSLIGVRFIHKDFRGFSFDGVDLTGAQFIDYDLRLATFNQTILDDISVIDCQLTFLNDLVTKSRSEADCRKYMAYLVLSKLTMEAHQLVEQTKNLFDIKDKDNEMVLISSVYTDQAALVKKILDHPSCTKEVLAITNSNGHTAFSMALVKNLPNIIKLMLAHQKCCESMLALRYTDLQTNCYYGYGWNLASSTYTLKRGDTLLIWAARQGYSELVKIILSHRYCPDNVLQQFNNLGESALIAAARNGNIEALEALLNHRSCTPACITQKNRQQGYNALLAAKHANQPPALTRLIAYLKHHQQQLDFKTYRIDEVFLWGVEQGVLELVQTLLSFDFFMVETSSVVREILGQALIQAALKGHLAIVKAIMSHANFSTDILNYLDKKGSSALMMAATFNRWKIVSAMLVHPSCSEETINLKDYRGNTALMLAVAHQHLATINVFVADAERTGRAVNCDRYQVKPISTSLLGQSTDPAEVKYYYFNNISAVNHGDTLLIWAARLGHAALVEKIIRHPSFTAELLNMRNVHGRSALMEAARYQEPAVLSLLLNHPACTEVSLNMTDRHGYTALILAALEGVPQGLEAILHHPAFTKEMFYLCTHSLKTVLLAAISNSRMEMSHTILSHSLLTADMLNQQDQAGDSALIIAVRNKSINVVEAILRHRFCTQQTLERQNHKGYSAFMEAVRNNKQEIMTMMMKHCYWYPRQFSLVDRKGKNALILAVQSWYGPLSNLILQHPDCRSNILMMTDYSDGTVLYWAVRKRDIDVVQKVLSHRHIYPEILMQQNNEGYTALMAAAKLGFYAIVKAILEHPHCSEAMLKLKNIDGHTARDVAKKNHCPDIAALIKKFETKLSRGGLSRFFGEYDKKGNDVQEDKWPCLIM